jgi:catechol 2,3-dioxygenase
MQPTIPLRFDVCNQPDGNGIELYHDRDMSEWPRDPEGGIAMVTAPLDMAGLLAEAR